MGIMTAHLLSPIVQCLKSVDDEVCMQTIKLCAKMKLNDPDILHILLSLLKSQRAFKVSSRFTEVASIQEMFSLVLTD